MYKTVSSIDPDHLVREVKKRPWLIVTRAGVVQGEMRRKRWFELAEMFIRDFQFMPAAEKDNIYREMQLKWEALRVNHKKTMQKERARRLEEHPEPSRSTISTGKARSSAFNPGQRKRVEDRNRHFDVHPGSSKSAFSRGNVAFNSGERKKWDERDRRRAIYPGPSTSAVTKFEADASSSNLDEKRRKLSGAGVKRYKFFLRMGHSVEEAKELAKNPIGKRGQNLQTVSEKRKREEYDTPPQTKDEKKFKPSPPKRGTAWTPSSSGLHRNEHSPYSTTEIIKMAVISTEYPRILLSKWNMEAITNLIEEAIVNLRGNICPRFIDTQYHAGYMVLYCEGRETADWIKDLALRLKPWRDASLCAVEENAIPTPTIMVGSFNDSSDLETDKILSFVEKQNRGVRASLWKVLRRENIGTRANLMCEVDRDSVWLIEEAKGFLFFRLGKCHLKLPGRNESDWRSVGNIDRESRRR